ncbi:MAG: pantetheine-phosphate adenylyltransferase [Candidatus Levyibacteriota bacterium]
MSKTLPAGRQEFNTVVLGGTFDHLHKGHKEFIRFALSQSEKIVVGLTSDAYVRKVSSIKHQVSSIESYKTRKENLEKFLIDEKILDRAFILQIDDVYGITTSEVDIDALIVVEKTLEGARKINAKREELGLRPLQIVISPSVFAEDGSVMASSRIRAGEIDREGNLYVSPSWLKENLVLPDSFREELKKPLGELITDDDLDKVRESLIAVGDITAKKFNEMFLTAKISIIDFNVARERKFNSILELGFGGNEKIIKVDNPAGEITPEIFKAIREAFLENGTVIIQISGEEDLAVLPAILVAPLGAIVFYGQPEKGMVKILVSEEVKEKTYNLLKEFTNSK